MKAPVLYNDVKIIDRETIKFGDTVLDNFISSKGGVELGTMIALAGTSGAGKTTLCKKLQKDLPNDEISLFYSLESRASSVVRQTRRIKTTNKEYIADVDTFPTWSSFMSYINKEKPLLVVVDSLQHAARLLSEENGKYKYDNYKEIIKDLYDWKDKTQGIVILICQLNSDGSMEGPKSTIFDVDCPIFLTANPKTNERTMHTEKNRMGPIGKIYYQFTSDDRCIEFFTQEEWENKNVNQKELEILDPLIGGVENMFKSIDKKDVKRKKVINFYNKQLKKLNSIDCDERYAKSYIEMVFAMKKHYSL
jgi:predicted ATP-dependent serine protease